MAAALDNSPVYEQLARIGKCVSSAHRIELLELLAQGEKSVEALADEARLTVKNTSAHLRVLRGARLVEVRKAAQAQGLEPVAKLFEKLETLSSGQLGAAVVQAITQVTEKPEYRAIAMQLEMVAMNLKNLK